MSAHWLEVGSRLVAEGLLAGQDRRHDRGRALAAAGPVSLPWIAASLRRLEDVPADLAP
jgi:hypothetical protein